MLDVCADGWTSKTKTHLRWVYFGKLRATLPLGKHGKSRANAEIEVGHLRALARLFNILDCAKSEIEALR
jgi:hypothetical protein